MHRCCSRPLRSFSHSASAHARRSIQEIRQSRKAELESAEPLSKQELQQLLKRESERAFGPANIGDATAYVNKAADEAWKNILKVSGNDPKVFNAWRDDIKARAASLNKETPRSKEIPRATKSDPLGMRSAAAATKHPFPNAGQSSKGGKRGFPPKV